MTFILSLVIIFWPG